jgi:signal transduction histidine kinase
LRLRLLLAAAISIMLALMLAGLALVGIFESQVTARINQELNNHLLQLTAALAVDEKGQLKVSGPLADPRFAQPLSGLYWQVKPEGEGDIIASRSLWDGSLVQSPDGQIIGPEDEALAAAHRVVKLDAGGKEMSVTLTVATHMEEITTPVEAFKRSLFYYLGLIGLALLIAAWVQVLVGLKPLKALSQQLQRISAGQANRLQGEFPDEVAPLADELNAVLDAQDQAAERARARAGDLAHGLKTPLTVLGAIARDVEKKGLKAEARDIEAQSETMRLHVERQLARARISSGHGITSVPLRDNALKVIATMKRAPRGEELSFELGELRPDVIAMEKQDLTELLGNLLDNARKWAKSKVVLSFEKGILEVEDDGPGVPPEELGRIAERGRRLDENTQGSGLDLAIVKDIAEVYGAKLSFRKSPLGGLAVQVELKS